MNCHTSAAEPTRKISVPLLIGIIFLPFIFSWFLLREGYSTVARVVALGWAAIALLAMLTSSGDETQPAEAVETVAIAAENTDTSMQAAEKPAEEPKADTPSEPEKHLNAGQNSDLKDEPEPEPEPEPEEKLPEYTADEIGKAYDANPVAADQKFKGKRFIVTGIVTDAKETSILRHVYFSLKSRDSLNPEVTMKSGFDDGDFWGSVKVGEKIRLECTGSGPSSVIGVPKAEDCIPATATAKQEPSLKDVEEPEPEEKLPKYSMKEIREAYLNSIVIADRRFKGKRFIVTGVVNDIGIAFGKVYFTFENPIDPMLGPMTIMKNKHEDFVASVKKGQKISLECTGDNVQSKGHTPMFKDCVPVP